MKFYNKYEGLSQTFHYLCDMELTQNIIALLNGWVVLPTGKEENGLAATIQYELMQAGYMLNEEAYRMVEHAPYDDAVTFHREVIGYLRYMLGDLGNFKPFYEGFPQQVMELSHADLFINQLIYYWSNGHFIPEGWKGERPTAMEHPQYNMLRAADIKDFEAIFTTLCAANQSLTQQSRDTILWFVRQYPDVVRLLPEVIPFKETLCMLAAENMPVQLATATDVLRLAVYMSGGDISLPPVPPTHITIMADGTPHRYLNKASLAFRFKKFTRRERRMLLDHLEQSSCDASEMVLRAERWKRLGEILHVGDYARRYPRSAEAFCAVRNYARSWYAEVDDSADIGQRIAILSQRPGEYMRRIDHLLRMAQNDNERESILATFTHLLPRVSSKVLYELYNHFLRRTDADAARSIIIKGKQAPVFLEKLTPMATSLANRINDSIVDELKRRFAKSEPLGKVFIDEQLKNVPAPLQMRGLNPSLKTRVRGTRIPFDNPDARVVRFYLHWVDKDGYEDLDLFATFVSEDSTETISWATGLKSDCAVHSGDVRHHKGDCAEYIDVVMDEARKHYRYVIVSASNFERRPMNSLDAAFGYMEREHPESNPTWIPATAVNSFRFSSLSNGVHMVIVDLHKNEYIVLDIDSGSALPFNHVPLLLDVIHLYTETPTLDMYTLLSWHAESRGQRVESPEDVDIIMDFENFSTQYTECLKYMI